jgi:hypothetical protein
MSVYRNRDRLLASMGFGDYDSYLRSDLWRSIRAAVLHRDDGCCRLCGMPATEVHHRLYDEATMRGHEIEMLVSICRTCHQKIEFTSSGKKIAFKKIEQVVLWNGGWMPTNGVPAAPMPKSAVPPAGKPSRRKKKPFKQRLKQLKSVEAERNRKKSIFKQRDSWHHWHKTQRAKW